MLANNTLSSTHVPNPAERKFMTGVPTLAIWHPWALNLSLDPVPIPTFSFPTSTLSDYVEISFHNDGDLAHVQYSASNPRSSE